MSVKQDFAFENVLCKTPRAKFCKLVQPLSNWTNQVFSHHNFMTEHSIHTVTISKRQSKRVTKNKKLPLNFLVFKITFKNVSYKDVIPK